MKALLIALLVLMSSCSIMVKTPIYDNDQTSDSYTLPNRFFIGTYIEYQEIPREHWNDAKMSVVITTTDTIYVIENNVTYYTGERLYYYCFPTRPWVLNDYCDCYLISRDSKHWYKLY